MSASNAVFLIVSLSPSGRDGARPVDVEADGLVLVGHVRGGEVLHGRVLDVHAVGEGAGRDQGGRRGDLRTLVWPPPWPERPVGAAVAAWVGAVVAPPPPLQPAATSTVAASAAHRVVSFTG